MHDFQRTGIIYYIFGDIWMKVLLIRQTHSDSHDASWLMYHSKHVCVPSVQSVTPTLFTDEVSSFVSIMLVWILIPSIQRPGEAVAVEERSQTRFYLFKRLLFPSRLPRDVVREQTARMCFLLRWLRGSVWDHQKCQVPLNMFYAHSSIMWSNVVSFLRENHSLFSCFILSF